MVNVRKKSEHVFIPDTQITPTSDIRHIKAAGNYIADKQPNKIIIIGDWWDLPSLASYDKPGDKGWEDKDVKADIDCGVRAMETFIKLVTKPRGYSPEIHFAMGNHENRLRRAREAATNRMFKGFLEDSAFKLRDLGIIEHEFLEIFELDGIHYSHYFVNPVSLMTNPIGGTIDNKLNKLGISFSMGHQQHKQIGSNYDAMGRRRCGLVCGRFYQEDMEYLGPQKNRQSWSGIMYKHEVHDGEYDLMEISMNYLLDKWV